MSYIPGTVALNSHCALLKAAVISTLTCRFLSLLHSSVWKWHLQTCNTDNYSHILWESLSWLKARLAFLEQSCFFSPKTHFASLSCSHQEIKNNESTRDYFSWKFNQALSPSCACVSKPWCACEAWTWSKNHLLERQEVQGKSFARWHLSIWADCPAADALSAV